MGYSTTILFPIHRSTKSRGGSGGLSDSNYVKARDSRASMNDHEDVIPINEVNGVTTELELLDSLYIRYYKLVAASNLCNFALCLGFRLIFFQMTEVLGFFVSRIRIVSWTLRNIWRQLLLGRKYEIT